MAVNVQISQADLDRTLSMLAGVQDGAPRAMASALNKTAAKSKTRSNEEIRKQIRVTATYIRQRIKGPNDSNLNKAFFDKLTAKITAPKRGLLLSYFATTKPGIDGNIKVKVKPGGTTTVVDGKNNDSEKIFWMTLKGSGKWSIMERRASKTGAVYPHVLYGPSLSQVLDDVKDQVMPEMNDYLRQTLNNEIARVLARYA